MLNAELVAAVVLNLEFQKLDRDGLGEGVTGLFLNCGFGTYCYTVSFQSFHLKILVRKSFDQIFHVRVLVRNNFIFGLLY